LKFRVTRAKLQHVPLRGELPKTIGIGSRSRLSRDRESEFVTEKRSPEDQIAKAHRGSRILRKQQTSVWPGSLCTRQLEERGQEKERGENSKRRREIRSKTNQQREQERARSPSTTSRRPAPANEPKTRKKTKRPLLKIERKLFATFLGANRTIRHRIKRLMSVWRKGKGGGNEALPHS